MNPQNIEQEQASLIQRAMDAAKDNVGRLMLATGIGVGLLAAAEVVDMSTHQVEVVDADGPCGPNLSYIGTDNVGNPVCGYFGGGTPSTGSLSYTTNPPRTLPPTTTRPKGTGATVPKVTPPKTTTNTTTTTTTTLPPTTSTSTTTTTIKPTTTEIPTTEQPTTTIKVVETDKVVQSTDAVVTAPETKGKQSDAFSPLIISAMGAIGAGGATGLIIFLKKRKENEE